MVRVFIKGGIWKNSEDEILKAAVMKYGKQQWARVASLLNRKSAKQCKARWVEWLDPSVKKIEWSREEEEKLLHLAKLMPSQWRSIGPLVGRTATQCQEKYEQLLDAAASGGGGEGGDNDPSNVRRLKPGEIDAHPETKPARPDPIDMDEDEIEMLQEARARLANTQGKKAKRKQREKMLSQAKRLADLQKRRELKQAGLLSGRARTRSRKRQREVDYATEIPFHKQAPAGFHDVAAERAKQEEVRKKRLRSVNYRQVNEAQYRARDAAEAAARKKEELRLKNLERANMQLVVQKVSEKADPVSQRKRGVLSLPEPVVGDEELKEVAKLAAAGGMLPPPNRNPGNSGVTEALMGDYADRPLPTPMRTPVASGSTREDLLREASNLKVLSEAQTPLLGGPNEELVATQLNSTLQSNVTKSVNETPRLPPSATPLRRDALNLNSGVGHGENWPNDMESVSDVASLSTFGGTTQTSKSMRERAREDRRNLKLARRALTDALRTLPVPQYEYDLAAPEQASASDEALGSEKISLAKDAADIEAEQQERLKAEAAALYAKRSSVVKRSDLPRPAGFISQNIAFLSKLDSSEKLLWTETLTLMRHDAHAHPYVVQEVGGESSLKRKRKKTKKGISTTAVAPEQPLDFIPEDMLDLAKRLLSEEVKRQVSSNDILLCTTASRTGALDLPYDGDKGWNDDDVSNNSLSAVKAQFEAITEASKSLKKRNDKLSANLTIQNGGYVKRANALQEEQRSLFADLQNTIIEKAVYAKLLSNESRAVPTRILKLEEDVRVLQEKESELQKNYGNLILEKNRLLALAKNNLKTT